MGIEHRASHDSCFMRTSLLVDGVYSPSMFGLTCSEDVGGGKDIQVDAGKS